MYITQPRSLIVHDTSAIDCYFSAWVISYAAGFVRRRRPISTEAQIGLSYAVEKGIFRLKFFRLRIRLADPVEKLDFFDWILQSKNSVEKLLHMYFKMIASPIPPPNTHGHTATHPHQVPHCSIIQSADSILAIPAVDFRSKSAWRIPSSARQQRVSHDGSSARSRSYAANNGCACCSFGGFQLRETPRT